MAVDRHYEAAVIILSARTAGVTKLGSRLMRLSRRATLPLNSSTLSRYFIEGQHG